MQLVYTCLLLTITLRFNCGESKICPTIKKSQNMNMIASITIIPCHSKIKAMKRKLNFQIMFGIWRTRMNEDFTIWWNTAKKAFPYSSGSKRCNLLLTEKLLTDKVDPRVLLNKRSEIVSKCRYRHKFTLKGFRWLFNPPKQLVLKLIKVL